MIELLVEALLRVLGQLLVLRARGFTDSRPFRLSLLLIARHGRSSSIRAQHAPGAENNAPARAPIPKELLCFVIYIRSAWVARARLRCGPGRRSHCWSAT